MKNETMNVIEFIEKYAILILGVKDNPIPSKIHIQKELFILSNTKNLIKENFDFEKHYIGPFSQSLNDIIENPVYIKDAFGVINGKITLKENGKEEYKKLVKKYSDSEDFNSLLSSMKMIREIYDKLSVNELLFLIYSTYPEYTEFSDYSDKLIKNKSVKLEILKNLLIKGIITQNRYEELLEERK